MKKPPIYQAWGERPLETEADLIAASIPITSVGHRRCFFELRPEGDGCGYWMGWQECRCFEFDLSGVLESIYQQSLRVVGLVSIEPVDSLLEWNPFEPRPDGWIPSNRDFAALLGLTT